MINLSANIKRSIRRYEPVKTEGFTLWPILVSEWEEFLIARPAIDIVQQAFPVRLAAMPLLDAYWDIHIEATAQDLPHEGLFTRALAALALSLRLGQGMKLPDRVCLFGISVNEQTGRLNGVSFRDPQTGEEKMLTPVQFQKIRQIIAEQNGVELESERANPDLIEAERILAERNGPTLKADIYDLISGIAAFTGLDEAEIEDWPILKLRKRQDAFQRAVDYIVCGIGEKSGCSWKNGNPVPHLFFDRDMSHVITMKQVQSATKDQQDGGGEQKT